MTPIASFALLLSLILVSPSPGAETRSESWPTFRANPPQSGVAATTLPEKPARLWTYDAGAAIESTAAIVDGRVYIGARNGKVLALGLATGKPLWTYQAEGEVKAAPGVRDGRVFIGDGAGVFHALDAATGQRLWTFKTGGQIISSANFDTDAVLFGSYDNNLYCLRAADGKEIWSVTTDAPVHCAPCLAGGQVVSAGCDGLVRFVDLKTGRQQGDGVKLDTLIAAAPVYDGRRLFVALYDGRLVAIDAATQQVLWSITVTDSDHPLYASPAFFAERLIFAGRDGVVRCVAAQDGKDVWQFRAKAKVDSSPAIVGNRVYFGSSDGRLYGLNRVTGAEEWRFDAGAPITASPAVGEKRLVIGAGDGAVYCFGEAGGQP